MIEFCESLERYVRRATDPVRVGCTVIGGENPVAVQSMTGKPVTKVNVHVAGIVLEEEKAEA